MAKTKDEVIEVVYESLRDVFDPEIPLNIVDLGLVYNVDLDDNNHASILITLTSMGCPGQEMLEADSMLAAQRVPGVDSASVEITFDPPWSPDKMTDLGRKSMSMLGFNF